jgi:hypothetical protein
MPAAVKGGGRYPIKEVLQRENQGLKVYPVDDSSVFSMTGTYFWFVLSMLSGLIYKKTPEAGTLFCCHSSCAEWQLHDSKSSGWGLAANALYDPFPPPESKRK